MDDPIFSLLSFLVQSDEKSDEDEMDRISEKFGFKWPQIPNSTQIKNAMNIFQADSSYLSSLMSMDFNVNFDGELLQKISDMIDINDLKYTHCKLIILLYISWNLNPTIDYFETVLRSLFILEDSNYPPNLFPKSASTPSLSSTGSSVSSIPTSNTISSLSSLSSSFSKTNSISMVFAIESCFQFYFSTNRFDLFSRVFTYFHTYFIRHPESAYKIQHLVPEFLHMIIRNTKSENQNSDSKKSTKDDSKGDSKNEIITSEMIEYVRFLNQIYENCGFEIYRETATSLINLLVPYLPRFDHVILKFFSNYSSLITDNMHSSISYLLLKPLSELIESKPPFVYPTDENGQKIENIYQSVNELPPPAKFPVAFSHAKMETGYKFVAANTFQNGVDVRKVMHFSDKPDISTLIRKDVNYVLDHIIKSLQNREPSQIALISSFAQNMQNESPYFFDYTAVMIKVFQGIRNPTLLTLFWNTIFDTIIFDERINVYNLNQNFLLFDQLRSLIFNCLTFDKFSFLADVLQSFTTKLTLIDETIQRILCILNSVSSESLTNPKLIQIISSLMIYFQSLNIQCDESLIPIIENTRASIFLFLIRIFENNSYDIRLWLSNILFLSTFFSFLFEKPVRPIILIFIKNYIINTKTHFFYGTIEKIEEIVSLMVSQVPNEDATDLACDLLEIICEFQLHRRRQKLNFFLNLSDAICSSLPFLTNSPCCSRYLASSISFLSTINKPLNQAQLDLLSVSILRVEGESPNSEFFPKLTQLLAGEKLSSTNPTFLIRQPGVLNLLLMCYIHSSQFEQVFTFIKQLLEYSFYNANSSTVAGFDCLLLDQINLLKNDIQNEAIINCFLDILEHICTTTSSKNTPLRFLNLLSPIRKKWLSPFELQLTQKLTHIIRKSSTQPDAWLPLGVIHNVSSYVSVSGLTESNIPKSFLIVSWIYLDQPSSQDHVHIFEIIDSHQCGFIGFISSGNFLISNFNTEYESTAKIDIPIPPGVWSPISVFVQLSATPGGKSRITAYIGAQSARRIEFSWDMYHDNISVVAGTSIPPEMHEETPAAFLSSLTLYDVNKVTNITMFIEKGPRHVPLKSLNPFLYLSMISKNGHLSFKTESKFNINAEYKGELIECAENFCNVLRKNDIARLFLPLFTLMDYQTTNKEFVKEFPELLFDLLSAALQVDEEQQYKFDKQHGMEILSYLLNSSNAYEPSYNTYMRIYSNLPSFIKPLQESVISLFLLDFKNMINSPMKFQLRLAKHWSRVLTAGYPKLIKSITPLLVLIFEQFISDDPLVTRIRQYLNEMVKKIASTNIDQTDLRCLISLPLSAPIEYQSIITYEILGILTELIENTNGAIYKLDEDSLRYLTLTNLYLQTAETDVMISLLRLIVLMHRTKLLKDVMTLDAHIEMIMREVRSFYAQSSVINGIAQLINQGMEELMPLCFFLVTNSGDSAADELFKILKPTVQNPVSLRAKFWAIVVAIKASRDVQHNLLRYLMLCTGKDDTETAFIIEIVSLVLEDNTGSLLREHLNLIALNILDQAQAQTHGNNTPNDNSKGSNHEESNDENSTSTDSENELKSAHIDIFYQLASHFLLFRRQSQSAMLTKEFELSIFHHENKVALKKSQSNVNAKSLAKPKAPTTKITNSHLKPVFGDMKSLSMMLKPNSKLANEPVSRSGSFHKLMLMIDDKSDSSSDNSEKIMFPTRQFYIQIFKYASQTHSRALGLKFDKNGNWIDRDIALKSLMISEINLPPYFIPYDLMISAFLFKKNRIQVEKHLQKLNLTPRQLKANINSIHLLSKYTKKQLNNMISWIDQDYNDSAVFQAYEEMENRRSIAKEKYGQKLAMDFSEANRKIDYQIQDAFSIRKNGNSSAYFIESKVIEFHSKELMYSEEYENYWKVLFESK
ncbi:hypothetical protein TRFO_26683 [Tritrichomonas foetus]|uniref:Beige/BEACH domain containing protein n=1 Tax=Tritrichomonas foetus TaxID=1144522 RepID=A0A1J4K743_9EUKA|nr:hypothetical protein TRFO_26683 [Tritrichomonas foetus]|eukprot:OHT05542.1 hypothetical protein TRFO_26683 [Tritrichomonas foetus]